MTLKKVRGWKQDLEAGPGEDFLINTSHISSVILDDDFFGREVWKTEDFLRIAMSNGDRFVIRGEYGGLSGFRAWLALP